ncbi:D-xylose transport system permease protein [Dongia mobilis]|uniref:D-xylose transport system permease protein n=1 Tax=Dongia mobilis TaxID=578943 RepID=A0A4R6WQT3_9PROT|nr:sugar ABC transporter permease [Dongia mobilis]TDQ82146.1 D-xylose transport system permease protein [Dongia mobilis]
MTHLRNLMARLEIDERLLGMIFCLAAIWIGFDILSDGRFVTPRNLYNLSLQTTSVAIMAIGMVLVIIIRQIDLSVGSMLGVTAMVVGVVQAFWLPNVLGAGHPMIVVIAVVCGIVLGAALGGLNGLLIGYLGVPSFVVTLGGLLIWRGCAWWVTQGQTVAPLDETFTLLGGGVYGTIGETASWVVGIIAVLAIAIAAHRRRRRRIAYGFPVRPLWAELLTAGSQCALALGFVAVMNAYEMPAVAAQRLAEMEGWEVPAEGLQIFMGIPIPVIILIALALAVSLLLNRTRFGRYVYAMGGNPEAAERAGINTKRMTVLVFTLMGALVGISAIVASARLQSAGNSIGSLDELRVIAAAVIGGCSLAGGAGTIAGAILGAVVIQSLQSGMSLLGYDASLQNIVTGLVLVLAVYVDRLYQQRRPY